jgi:hypothetical protein
MKQKYQRTLVHTRQILERGKQEHSDDAHAKDLHAPAGHVQHESLHGQRLDWRNSKIPSFSRLQIFIRVHRCARRRSRTRGRGLASTRCFSLIMDRYIVTVSIHSERAFPNSK